MSEKLYLQWNDFKENAVGAFGILREDADFADVTLACEDGKQVEAHKVILASSSPFFQNLLKRKTHPHPLIYMTGVKSDDLLAIVDFIYHGEANVFQEHLDSFLAIAEELQLKGLMGKAYDYDEERAEISVPKKEHLIHKKVTNIAKDPGLFSNERILSKELDKSARTVALSSFFGGDLKNLILDPDQELNEKCHSMMEKTSNKHTNGLNVLYRCKECGKEDRNHNLKSHIEANHLEVSIPCNFCEKNFRSRKMMKNHEIKEHQ